MASSTESDSDSSDARSQTSSFVYAHESFAQFQDKALALARSSILPHAEGKENITVERLQGGTYNRVIGLTITSSQSKDQESTYGQSTGQRASETITKYVLRIPRYETAQIDADVAALLFVKRLPRVENDPGRPDIPVPEVIAFDETENNCLGSCFMIQERLRGESLLFVYAELEHEQQRIVAQDLGHAYRRMLSVSSTQAGRLILPKGNRSLDAEIHVVPWDPCASIFSKNERVPPPSTPYRDCRAGESVMELLIRAFQEQKAELRQQLPADILGPRRIDQFCNMVSEMDAAGYFRNSDWHFALSHLDLEPRNILVDQYSPPDRPIISGILDWDSAVLAPAFMCCSPPMWIWNWKDNEDEDERLADEEPANPEQRELKAVFEAAAGPIYSQFAHLPAYRLARRLVRFAIDGILSSNDEKQAAAMLEEWQDLLRQDAINTMAAIEET